MKRERKFLPKRNMVFNSKIEKMWDFTRFRNNTALIDEQGIRVSYEEIQNLSNLIFSKIGRRCLVFSLCENSIGSVAGYVSFINNWIVPVMLSAHLERELLNNLLEKYRPSYVWAPEGLSESFNWEVVLELCDYVLLKAEYSEEFPLYDELALLLSTSGSTGSPKFVRQSYKNIRSNIDSIIEYLGLDSSERPITTLPMNYTYGLSIINTHLEVGASLLLTDKGLMQKEFWSFLKEYRATSLSGVPYTYEMLDKLRFYKMDLPSLQTMTQAGGKLTPELHEKFAMNAEETGRKFVVMYGQCEATARMGYLPAEKAVEKNGSMGIAIPGGEFRLIDSYGNEVAEPYTTGELVYLGDNVTLGYAENGMDLTKGDERHGKLITGDMAQFDEDGFYYIVGRKKRFLKIYGNRVNLDEMDRLIKEKFNVEVACAGIDDHMYIFLTDDDNATEIRDYVIQKTGLNPAAFKTRIIEDIPKNDSGKTLYKELKEYYDEV